MRDGKRPRVVKAVHIVLDQHGVKTAVDIDDQAVPDGKGNRLLDVFIERKQNIAAVHDDRAVDPGLVALGRQKAARPVVPATGRVRKAVFGQNRELSQLVLHIRSGRVGKAQVPGLGQTRFRGLDPLAQFLGGKEPRQHLKGFDHQQDAGVRGLNLQLFF